MTPRRTILGLVAWLAAIVLLPQPTLAQDADELRAQAEALLGRSLTDEDIVGLLRDSGLTPDELRIQLEAQGVDPGDVNSYLVILEGRSEDITSRDPTEILQIFTPEGEWQVTFGLGRSYAFDDPFMRRQRELEAQRQQQKEDE